MNRRGILYRPTFNERCVRKAVYDRFIHVYFAAMKSFTRPPMPLRTAPIAGLKNGMDAGARALHAALVTLEGTPLRDQLEACRSRS